MNFHLGDNYGNSKKVAAPVKEKSQNSGRNSKGVVKFPKGFKIQMGYLATKQERDSYKRIMLSALR